MSQAFMSPDTFVQWAAVEGFETNGGKVKLNQYLSSSESNGGAGTALDLMNKLKTAMTKAGSMPSFKNYVRIFTGQGEVNDFMALWNWMHANLPEVRKITVQTSKLDKNADKTFTKVLGKSLDLAIVFREGRPFPEAMAELVDAKCFGWDCIGFISQYLITISHINEYPSWKSDQYLTLGKFEPVKSLAEVNACCVIVFGEVHIVMVNSADSLYTDKYGNRTMKVSVSQSYTGGPHTRFDRTLMQKAGAAPGEFTHTGVTEFGSSVKIGKNPDIAIRF